MASSESGFIELTYSLVASKCLEYWFS